MNIEWFKNKLIIIGIFAILAIFFPYTCESLKDGAKESDDRIGKEISDVLFAPNQVQYSEKLIFFDSNSRNKKSLIYFSGTVKEGFSLFNKPGVDPFSGKNLKPVTSSNVEQIHKYFKNKANEEIKRQAKAQRLEDKKRREKERKLENQRERDEEIEREKQRLAEVERQAKIRAQEKKEEEAQHLAEEKQEEEAQTKSETQSVTENKPLPKSEAKRSGSIWNNPRNRNTPNAPNSYYDYNPTQRGELKTLVIPRGTPIHVSLSERVSSRTHMIGSFFSANIDRQIIINGLDITSYISQASIEIVQYGNTYNSQPRSDLFRGSNNTGSLAQDTMNRINEAGRRIDLERANRQRGFGPSSYLQGYGSPKGAMVISLTTVIGDNLSFNLKTVPIIIQPVVSKKKKAAKIGVATGIGAVLGAILGGKKGAAAGALGGASTGVMASVYSNNGEVILKPGQRLIFYTSEEIIEEIVIEYY